LLVCSAIGLYGKNKVFSLPVGQTNIFAHQARQDSWTFPLPLVSSGFSNSSVQMKTVGSQGLLGRVQATHLTSIISPLSFVFCDFVEE